MHPIYKLRKLTSKIYFGKSYWNYYYILLRLQIRVPTESELPEKLRLAICSPEDLAAAGLAQDLYHAGGNRLWDAVSGWIGKKVDIPKSANFKTFVTWNIFDFYKFAMKKLIRARRVKTFTQPARLDDGFRMTKFVLNNNCFDPEFSEIQIVREKIPETSNQDIYGSL